MRTKVPIPRRLASCPRDEDGRPIPWYAYTDTNGKVDHGLFRPDAIDQAVRFARCWCCGTTRGKYGTYIASASVLIDGQVNEPPSHSDCARYAAGTCPFLAGSHGEEQPRAVVLYTSARQPQRIAAMGNRFWVGPPTSVYWFACGEPATNVQARQALDAAYQSMRAQAAEDAARVTTLERLYAKALAFLPVDV